MPPKAKCLSLLRMAAKESWTATLSKPHHRLAHAAAADLRSKAGAARARRRAQRRTNRKV